MKRDAKSRAFVLWPWRSMTIFVEILVLSAAVIAKTSYLSSILFLLTPKASLIFSYFKEILSSVSFFISLIKLDVKFNDLNVYCWVTGLFILLALNYLAASREESWS